MTLPSPPAAGDAPERFDHSSDPNFVSYYEQQSLSAETQERFNAVLDRVLALRSAQGLSRSRLQVADIGCGPGTQALLWARLGHDVRGLDVNEAFVELARRRGAEQKLDARFELGTATKLPFADESMDVCLLPELLEHVPHWQPCLDEATRVLRPNGVLYLSTTNRLCPRQQEFDLPLYSWYPSALKRRYERLAVTTRPELVSYAKYPAVHWFSFFQLRDYLAGRGLQCFDRFDLLALSRPVSASTRLAGVIRAVPPLRWIGHILTPYTVVFALKNGARSASG